MQQNSPNTQGSSAASSGWGDSPWIAFGIRVLVFAVPVLLSFAVTWSLAAKWQAPATVGPAILRFAVIALVAVAVAALADKFAKRFLPLAALFRLSLVFPDQAPSRFAVALRAGNTRRIEQRLQNVESGGFRGDEADAALLVVELAAALSQHDRLTRGHSERVRAFTALIAEEMGLSEEDSNKLQWAGLIHDVGKLRVPQEILTKPGRLTEDEFAVIKTHPAEGLKIAQPLAGFLGPWIGAVGEHHERFDGNGYPSGLSGTDISLAGRIVAVADAYDVITAARSYKKPLAPEFARRELANNAGSQFDPVVVRAFLSISLGRLRRAMWPLSWAVQVPYLGAAVTTPVSQTIAAAVITLATATGVTAATGGFDAFEAPEAIAMVDLVENEIGEVVEVEPSTPPETAPPLRNDETVNTELEPLVDRDPSGPEVGIEEESTTTVPTALAAFDESTTTAAPTTVARSSSTTTAPTTTTTTTIPLTDCQRAQSGDTVLIGAQLQNCDMSGVELSGGNFDGADLTSAVLTDTTLLGGSFVGAIFDRAVLNGAEIANADLRNTSWADAELRQSGLSNVNMQGADLTGAMFEDIGISGDLSNAVLERSTIVRAGFDGSTMMNTSLRSSQISQSSFTLASLQGLDLRSTVMREVTFENATLNNALFTNSAMSSMVFVQSRLPGTNFSSAAVSNSNFYAATITDASFVGAVLSNLNMVDVVGPRADFTNARLDVGSMVTGQLTGAIFHNAQILAWDFNGAAVNQTDFSNASFATSSLQSADATQANFRAADFASAGVFLYNTNLHSADFSGATGTPSEPAAANYDNTTCPDGAVQAVTCW